MVVVAWQIIMWTLVSTAFGAGIYRYVKGGYLTPNFGVSGYTTVYNPTVRDTSRGHVVEAQAAWFDSNNMYEVGWVKGLDQNGTIWNSPKFFVAWVINGVPGEITGSYPGIGTNHYHMIKNSFASGLPTHIWEAYIDDGTDLYKTINFYQATQIIAQSEVADVFGIFTSTLNGYHWNLQYGSAYMSYFIWVNWTGTAWSAESPYYFIGHNNTWYKSGGP